MIDTLAQPDLFTTRYPLRAGSKEKRGTSADAADAIEASGRASNLRSRVMQLFDQRLELTADECAHRLGESILSIRPRLSELHTAGLIKKTEYRRENAIGSACRVFRKVRQ